MTGFLFLTCILLLCKIISFLPYKLLRVLSIQRDIGKVICVQLALLQRRIQRTIQERTEHQTLRSMHTSFASSTVINLFKHASGESSCFLRDLTVSLILCFRRSIEVSPYFCYRPLFRHLFAILSSLIHPPCPYQLSSFIFILTLTFSIVPAILCTSALQIDQLS